MRLCLASLLLSLTLAAILSGCSKKDQPRAADRTPTPTAADGITADQVLVGAGDLPGCTLEQEGSFFQNTASRRFACANGEVLSFDLKVHQTVDEARLLQDNSYGTKDGATDIIRASVRARPVDQSSLQITDVTSSFGAFGADEQDIYCATYTGLGGSPQVVEYYGSFRYKRFVVEFRSFTNGGTCDGPSRAQENARALASKELEKLRATYPAG